MTIKDMHYDFKKKLNKVDSQNFRNLLIPEIDWTLNEAYELFVKMVSQPRVRNTLGFETSQRTIDDIRTIVESNKCLPVVNNIVSLPIDYMFYIKGNVKISKNECKNQKGKLYIRQHDDDFEDSYFDKSSFEWRTVNGVFIKDGIEVFSEDFKVDELCISYIRKLKYIHNAEEFKNGQYRLPSGIILSGSQNCELPEHTHKEIVDIAVMIVTGELQIPDYEIKRNKLLLNQIN